MRNFCHSTDFRIDPIDPWSDWSPISAADIKKQKKSLSNTKDFFLILAVWTGLEPATPCVTGMYSNQLNYQTNISAT